MKKVILFLWFGDEKPPYVQWTFENFSKMNPGWEIRFIEYSNDQILNHTKTDDLLLTKIIQDKDNWKLKLQYTAMNYISDKYRLLYLNTHKDEFIIYCDLDCFPIAPFDDFIIQHELSSTPKWIKDTHPIKHISQRHIGNWSFNYNKTYAIKQDGWCICNNTSFTNDMLIQMHKGSVMDNTLILYKSMFMNKSAIPEYEQRSKDFHEMKIELGDNFCLPQFTPIEHYCSLERTKLNKNVEKEMIKK